MRDIASINKCIDKLQNTPYLEDKYFKEKLTVLDFIYPKMNKCELIHDIQLDVNQKKYIQILSLLTNKPTLYILNVVKNELSSEMRSLSFQQLFIFADKNGNAVIRLCGKHED